ncbi:MAG: T9SS type A sorting domain-containing protein [Flavipsychrobacter sp.]
MKRILLISMILSPLLSFAQVTGPGIEYTYDAAGFRVKRDYNIAAVLQKPGKDNGQQADTIIGVFKNKELFNQEFVRAYPNPASDFLFVENISWEEGNTASIQLLDITGKVILSKTTNESRNQISLNAIVPGTYNVNYYLNDRKVISWKIIKL